MDELYSYNMFTNEEIRGILDFFNVFVCGCVLLSLHRASWHESLSSLNRILRRMLIGAIILFLTDILPCFTVPYASSVPSRISLHISYLVFYYVFALIPRYFSEYIRLREDVSRAYSRMAMGIAAAGGILWTIAFIVQLTVSDHLPDHLLQALYLGGQIPGIAIGLVTLLLIFRNRKAVTRRASWVMILYVIIPIGGYLIRLLDPPGDFFYSAIAVAFLTAYAEINLTSNRMLLEEAAAERGRALAARIGPEEILGSLDEISELCLKNPEAAREALDEFSTDMRRRVRELQQSVTEG